ncbi:hypothetical protein [Alteromonas facilis]|uniref:hypothetical protein n=1 Tax=Alteromonas facilis TaxID=2048004 RepID=UPI001F0B8BEA|nr:hypothetical protein [Alteromonas facilis]
MQKITTTLAQIFCTLLVLLAAVGHADTSLRDPDKFYHKVMNAAPYVPADLSVHSLSCKIGIRKDKQHYRSANTIDYSKAQWSERVAADWHYLDSANELGRIAIIDFALNSKQELAYRYLANARHNELYEPWSSSKIFAYAGAIATLRQSGIGATSHIGDVSVADLITSIHSYRPTHKAPDDSNAIATFFANIAGRDYLTALFHDQWLRMDDTNVRFRGAYGLEAYKPTAKRWVDGAYSVPLNGFKRASDDPGYQSYLCSKCGKTGNKPMSALAQAEWLKRLASHTRVTATQQPYLKENDVSILFYGDDGRGGMMAGISTMLADAIAIAIDPSNQKTSKEVLDQATNGQWRIFQKIGWGPSETRGAGETVVLAHVCLPEFDGGREFTLAAQTAQSGTGDEFVGYAGIKMQHLLNQSIRRLLNR